jgi:diaminopimelate epimerase
MNGWSFWKMHGLGNDFVVLDGRARPLGLDTAAVRRLADRRTGIGCDQVILMEPPRRGGDLAMRIWNADGGEVESCGNATRCVARLAMAESGRDMARIETAGGDLACRPAADGQIAADMGRPDFDWARIPLARDMDTMALDYAHGGLERPAAVNVGNPHVVFFVEDAAAFDLGALGPAIEHDPLFPRRINVSLAQVADRGRIVLRVWERGAGLTRACGTAACAALVCAARRGLTERAAEVCLPGGALSIEWRAAEDHIVMTGPAALSFEGRIGPDLLADAGAAFETVRGAA